MEREHVVRAEIQDGRKVEVEVLSKAKGRGGLPRTQKLFVGRTATRTVKRMASQALKTGRSKSRTRSSLSRAGLMPRGELRRVLSALWRSAEKESRKMEKGVDRSILKMPLHEQVRATKKMRDFHNRQMMKPGIGMKRRDYHGMRLRQHAEHLAGVEKLIQRQVDAKKSVDRAVGVTPTGKVIWRDPSKSEFFKDWTVVDHQGAARTWLDQGEEDLSKGHEEVADDLAEDKKKQWFKAREAAWVNYQAQVLLGNVEKAAPHTFGKPRLTRADKERTIKTHGLHGKTLDGLQGQLKDMQDTLTRTKAGGTRSMVSRDWMKTLKHAIDTHPRNPQKLAAPAKPRRAQAARTKPRQK